MNAHRYGGRHCLMCLWALGVPVLACGTAAARGDAVPAAIVAAANGLVANQSGGSWTGEESYTGTIIGGLANAYDLTGNASYLSAATAGADYIQAAAGGNYRGDEAYGLLQVARFQPNPTNNQYYNAIRTYYNTTVPGTVGGTAGYADALVNSYVTKYGTPSESVIYLAYHTLAAYEVNATDKGIWRSTLITTLGAVDDADRFPVGELGAAVALADTGSGLDGTMISGTSIVLNQHPLSDLPGILGQQIVASGATANSFYYRFTGSTSGYTEDTAFGILGLAAANDFSGAAGYGPYVSVSRQALTGAVGPNGATYVTVLDDAPAMNVYAGRVLQAITEEGQSQNSWGAAGGGAFGASANWLQNHVPTGVDEAASFNGTITADSMVTLSADVTVGTLSFRSAHSYTLCGAGILTIACSQGTGQITVYQGSHAIQVPLVVASDTDITVAQAGSVLTLAQVTFGGDVSVVKAGAGTLQAAQLNMNSLTVLAGTVTIAANGTSAALSSFNALSITSGAKVDLNDNDMILHNAAVGTVTAWVHSAYAGGAWSGSGLTSGAAAGNTTGLGMLSGAAYKVFYGAGAQFDGQPVADNDVLVKYTYAGDLNLDGRLTAADYALLDAGYLAGFDGVGQVATWGNGDVNYDGVVDWQDYQLVDAAFVHGGSPLAGEMMALHAEMFGASYVAGVPEPGSLGLMAGAMGMGVLRQKRRRG